MVMKISDIIAKIKRGVKYYRIPNRWVLYQRLHINNPLINLLIKPINRKEFSAIENGRIGSLNITSKEYKKFLEHEELRNYRKYTFAHNKILEYITTYILTEIDSESSVLDAAGGLGGYIRVIKRLKHSKELYCNDMRLAGKTEEGITFIGGNIDAMELASESLTSITCHHSFEHFREDNDIRFIKEVVRLLKVGGKACIVPLFLCNRYCEIWNKIPDMKFDKRALTIYDPLGTFPGWGPYERFARAYDIKAFRERLVAVIPKNVEWFVCQILYEGRPCPDIKKNCHQPRLNAEMKALLLHKKSE